VIARYLAVLAICAQSLLLVAAPPSAQADECSGQTTVSTGSDYDTFTGSAGSSTSCNATSDGTGTTSTTPGTYHHKPVCLGGVATCDIDGFSHCSDGSVMEYVWFVPDGGAPGAMSINCPSDPTAPPGPSVADIVTAFRRIPLPRSTLQIQPPDGETLVNFTTNFLTEAEAFTTSVTLLGHRVDFRITPSRFRWAYGDGSGATTAKPGARYPTMGVTHVYRKRGAVKAAVDTTWSADYRVDGGGWAAVPDTVTIAGAAQALTVRSATPLLAGADR
jgi:hypothetical protein